MNHPTNFQIKLLWAAITALSCLAIGSVLAVVGSLIVNSISFLQPVLIPVAVAAILAFLLDPVVKFFMRLGLSRLLSIAIVYIAVTGLFIGLLVYIVPPAYRQGTTLIKNFPIYMQKTEALTIRTMNSLQHLAEIEFFRTDKEIQTPSDQFSAIISNAIKDAGNWVQQKIPDLAVESGKFIQRSVGGFLGVFGLLLSMILVPIFLFFFLKYMFLSLE